MELTNSSSPVVNQGQEIKTPSLPPIPEGAKQTDGFSTSFIDYAGGMKTLGEDMSKLDSETANLYAGDGTEDVSHAANIKNIKTGAELSREELSDTATAGEQQRQEAGELLGLAPAAIRSSIDKFTIESDNFTKSIIRARERIESDMETALMNEDVGYYKNLQTEKINYIQMERQALEDRSSFMTTAFNAIITGKDIQRQDTADATTRVTNAYTIGQVPSQEDWTAAGYQGAPPKQLDLSVWTPPYMLDGKLTQQNKQTGEIRAISVPLDTPTDTATVSSWANSVERNPAEMAHVPAALKSAVNNEVEKRRADKKAGIAAKAAEPSWFDKITNYVGLTNIGVSTSSPAAVDTGGVSSNSSIDDLINQANSIIQ